MTAPVTPDQPPRGSTSEAQLVELRVQSANTYAELNRLRADVSPLLGLPQQLDALARLWEGQLAHLREHHDRDVIELRRDLHDVRQDIDELRGGQTWAVRLVVAAVIVAVLGLLVGSAVPGAM